MTWLKSSGKNISFSCILQWGLEHDEVLDMTDQRERERETKGYTRVFTCITRDRVVIYWEGEDTRTAGFGRGSDYITC